MTGRHRLAVPDPPLVVDGLELRRWAVGDRDDLVEAWADPEVRRWTAVPDDVDSDVAARWIAGEERRREAGLALDLVGVAVNDGRLLGEVGLSAFDMQRGAARIGWWVAASERGRGVATSMVRVLTAWAHAGPLALRAVVAEVDPANPASAAVARAAGFRLLSSSPEAPMTTDAAPPRLVFASVRPDSEPVTGIEGPVVRASEDLTSEDRPDA
ncbi:MAG TPA: hypothetical protein DGK99_02455 [Acidimicrobiaceae bacterium]|nr:GNAT family N-acetyltransferase [Acidimicrobiales bacterium]HCW00250.1 hypothetical protein [Acidimicrobiaceae bacterium]